MKMIDSLFPFTRTSAIRDAIDQLAASDESERGAVYTKPEVVRAILDLAGYTADRPLHRMRLLDPCFGGGEFLLTALDRLIAAWSKAGDKNSMIESELQDALFAVEIHAAAFNATRASVLLRLEQAGVAHEIASRLADSWLHRDDFLLASIVGEFDFVVGNPPYVRQERIPNVLLAEYRRRYATIFDRADLYVPFIERSLSLLKPGGRLGFICANRWMKNKYGGPLRQFAASEFHLRYFIDLEGSPAFHSEVIAYPAITIFERSKVGITRIARRPEVSDASLSLLVTSMLHGSRSSDNRIDEVESALNGSDPWILDAPAPLRLLRRLEDRFPDIENAHCKVGIGVATGADAVFIGNYDSLPVEEERKLPLLMAKDLFGLRIAWRGNGVVNPFNDDGSLADLDVWPRFGAYMRQHQERIAGRHCARRVEGGWYRTIDRIRRDLTTQPKLVIPDIKGEPTVVLDEGRYYPHHNLYYVVSDDWELSALGTILRSSVAVLFISSYCVRMSGGFLRFQAQYLRRIRVPRWRDLSSAAKSALRSASTSLDLDTIDYATALAYSLNRDEARLVRQLADEVRIPRKTNADSVTTA